MKDVLILMYNSKFSQHLKSKDLFLLKNMKNQAVWRDAFEPDLAYTIYYIYIHYYIHISRL